MTSPASAPHDTAAASAGPRCPKCNGGQVRRSKRKREDGLLHRLLYHAYRCRGCRNRFWRINSTRIGIIAVAGVVIVAVIAGGLAVDEHVEQAAAPVAAQSAGPGEAPAAAPAPRRPATNSPVASPGLFRLAEQGDARAQFNLATAYVNGQGVVKNMTLAHDWYDKAAQQGSADAQYALGLLYLAGRGVRQNFESAFKWFEKAAQQDHAAAQFETGVLYRTGNGVALDKTKAYLWFNLAAAQGHEQAAIERDRLLPTMTAEQVSAGQRLAQSWRPAARKP